MSNNMVVQFGGSKSETATNNDKDGIEYDSFLSGMAKQKGIPVKKLLKSDFSKLTSSERTNLFLYSSAVLSKDAERMMIDEFRGDREKLNHLLFNHNARAATMLATMYCYKFRFMAKNAWRYSMEDFLSSARYGLWVAAKRFDLDRMRNGKPVKFLTFASPWMFRYISEMVRESESKVDKVSLDAPVQGNKHNDDDGMELGEVLDTDTIAPGFDLVNQIPTLEDEENEVEIDDKDDPRITDDVYEDENFEDAQTEEDSFKHFNLFKHLAKDDGSEIDEKKLLNAMDFLCRRICKIDDAEKRITVLFVSRKLLARGFSVIESNSTPEIARVRRMFGSIPKSKNKLMSLLGLDGESFKKRCTRYAYALMSEN